MRIKRTTRTESMTGAALAQQLLFGGDLCLEVLIESADETLEVSRIVSLEEEGQRYWHVFFAGVEEPLRLDDEEQVTAVIG